MLQEYKVDAWPVPEPTPVATKLVPGWLEVAPMALQLVLPVVVIVYDFPITKLPASTVLTPNATNATPSVIPGSVPMSTSLSRVGTNSNQYDGLVMFIPIGTFCNAR